MRSFLLSGIFFLLSVFGSSAAADLYRWVDPETGSVKFSSYPPPWYGDPEKERRAPKVVHIPAGQATPPQNPEAGKPQDTATTLEALATLRKSLLKSFSALPPREDFNRAGAGLQQQLDSYKAVAAELDRLDPKGAAARKAESQPLLDKLLEGLRTQFSPQPPAASGERRP